MSIKKLDLEGIMNLNYFAQAIRNIATLVEIKTF